MGEIKLISIATLLQESRHSVRPVCILIFGFSWGWVSPGVAGCLPVTQPALCCKLLDCPLSLTDPGQTGIAREREVNWPAPVRPAGGQGGGRGGAGGDIQAEQQN